MTNLYKMNKTKNPGKSAQTWTERVSTARQTATERNRTRGLDWVFTKRTIL